MNSKVVLNVIEDVSRAPLDPSQWTEVGVGMRELFASSIFAIMKHDTRTNRPAPIHMDHPDPSLMDKYVHDYAGKSLLLDDMLKRSVGTLYSDQFYPDYDAYTASEAYNELFRPHWGEHTLLFLSEARHGVLEYFGIRRDGGAGHFEPDEFDLLRRLAAYIQNARLVNRELAAAQEMRRAFEATLDQLQTGVILLDSRGRAINLNREARQIVNSSDGIGLLRDGTPVAALADENVRLQRIVRRAIDTSTTMASRLGGVTSISRPSGRPPFGILVAALDNVTTEENSVVGAQRAVAIAFLKDPARHYYDADHLIAAALDLTPREGQLVAVLMSGGNLRDAAHRLGISEGTARGYVKQIFAKTGTAQQSALVSLAHRSVPLGE